VKSPEQTASSKNSSAAPQLDVEREIRFAVVMYGGVSLAIYINGVTQELLRMVRATARASPSATMLLSPEQLTSSEKVYRKIAELLDKEAGFDEASDHATRTRFIVDVISGTSAGGINGVFLAKALARNQTMDGLKKLWLTEGDLGKLLNDTKAEDYAPELGFAVQKPEKSLLNSQRMYRKLLEALEQMATSAPDGSPPLVNELDLFVTTTDIEGVPLPIRLADKVVYERRHRNVFHFRCEPRPTDARQQKLRRDDFTKEHDPFLAFAARCTSSFPFAFDAMQLGDIKTILDRYHLYEDDDPTKSNDPKRSERWDKFFKDYVRLGLIDISRKARGEEITDQSVPVTESTTELRKAFRDRSFGDGGYLDNKPFSYATSMLMRRQANCVVDRKLIYVEPTPEHPELAPRHPGPRPDFSQNVQAAVLDLPRQETIREDIERLYERNSIVQRVGNFARYIDEDAMTFNFPKIMHHSDYAEKDLKEMIAHGYGAAYGAYHRLKVHEITELLTCLVTRALEHDPASDAGDAIRELVTLWRNDKYKLLKPLEKRKHGKGNEETENQFLLDYDVHYRLRRLSFLSRRINDLAGVGQDGQLNSTGRGLLLAWLRRATKPQDETKSPENGKTAPSPPDSLEQLTTVKEWLEASEKTNRLAQTEQIPSPEDWLNDFRRELSAVKRQIDQPIQDARFTEEQFLDSNSAASQALQKKIAQLKLPWKDVEPLLSNNPTEKKAAVDALLAGGVINQLDRVANKICEIFDNVSSSGLVIATANDTDPRKGAQAARMCLKHYYDNFLVYDLITYPIQYGTGASEANIVQVYRVSPEDAAAIMQEKAGAPGDKLAGRALMSFGAFLDENWRKNDMLWGRLDGAERLIKILLGRRVDNGECAEFVREAHIEILREEILQGNGDAVCRLLSNALAHSAGSSNQHLDEIVNEVLKKPDLAPYLTEARRNHLVVPKKFDRQLDAEAALRYISRSTNITGSMLEGLADLHRFDSGKRAASWVTRFGATFWKMIAVAVPQSLGSIFFRHWLGLLYLFAFVLIAVGIFLNNDVKLAGWQVLGIVVAVHVVVSGIESSIRGGKVLRLVKAVAAFAVLALMAFGVLALIERFGHVSLGWPGELALAGSIALCGSFLLSRPRRNSPR
jgi:patatin-related protein